MKRCFQLGMWLLWTLGFSALGCATLSGPASTSRPVSQSDTRLAYRTTSDRLNLAGYRPITATHPDSTNELLPSLTRATLIISSPHPAGMAGLAQAIVEFTPEQGSAVEPSAAWPSQPIAIAASSRAEGVPVPPREVWVIDVPQWQVDAIVAKLERANFFKRSKILGADAFLAAEVGPRKIAKDCKSMPELDGLILRVRIEGHRVSSGPAVPSLSSLASPAPLLSLR